MQNEMNTCPPWMVNYNPIENTDSYKPSHYLQYPDGMSGSEGYMYGRGGLFDTSTLFGMQYTIDTYLSRQMTMENVERSKRRMALHGVPFNYEGFKRIVEKYDGFWPVRIRALPEGTVVPIRCPTFVVKANDEELAWVPSYMEQMLARLWYPSTIAISTREQLKVIKQYLELSSDNQGHLSFALHDFGGRGVTCYEQALLGGAAHLLTSMGTDTLQACDMLDRHYSCEMAGYSVFAAEHSTVCSWQRHREFDFYRNFVKKALIDREMPLGVPKIAACVSDAYHVFDATRFWISPEMRSMLKSSGGKLVIRPDSGEVHETLREVFGILEYELGDEIGRNSKGYKTLPSYLGVIQGDGMNRKTVSSVLGHLVEDLGWASDNIVFGSGGGLLQDVNRDTQKYKFMIGSVTVDSEEVDVMKDPVTDPGKTSMPGRLDVIVEDGTYRPVRLLPGQDVHPRSELVTVYDNRPTNYRTTFDECRARMKL